MDDSVKCVVVNFEDARKDTTPEAVLIHVQERAEHLAEPRPEYGHATNAVAIVGRRGLTRGLFLDRRAFLISYDPTLDEKNDRLAALLSAAGPVCAGINLEYYFSFVDNEGYGLFAVLFLGRPGAEARELADALPRERWVLTAALLFLLLGGIAPATLVRSPAAAAQRLVTLLTTATQTLTLRK